ncbi:MAG: hydroxyacid dehydrogenase, partial [Rhodocyclaceae bacterium]|nr:hydroxyacid dehydrogenase [Rhodocyclaceae bacterium]
QSALELVARHIPRARPPFAPAAHPWSVYLELADAGQSEELAQRLTAACADALARGLIRDAALPDTLAGMDALRALRENISEAQKREGISIKHDISLPIRRIPAFLDEAQHMLCARWPQLRIVCFGHLGDGNLHYNLSLADATANAALLAQEDAIHQAVHDLVSAHHGSISAEHGLGQLKRHAIARYKSPLELALMRTLKQTLDPHNLMNPGKVLPDA